MIAATRKKPLLPMLLMLLALGGMMLSMVGDAASHGIAELPAPDSLAQDQHHSTHDHHHHDNHDPQPDSYSLHHDGGNHTHETVGQLMTDIAARHTHNLAQPPAPYSEGSPGGLRYRLERPPKQTPVL